MRILNTSSHSPQERRNVGKTLYPILNYVISIFSMGLRLFNNLFIETDEKDICIDNNKKQSIIMSDFVLFWFYCFYIFVFFSPQSNHVCYDNNLTYSLDYLEVMP